MPNSTIFVSYCSLGLCIYCLVGSGGLLRGGCRLYQPLWRPELGDLSHFFPSIFTNHISPDGEFRCCHHIFGIFRPNFMYLVDLWVIRCKFLKISVTNHMWKPRKPRKNDLCLQPKTFLGGMFLFSSPEFILAGEICQKRTHWSIHECNFSSRSACNLKQHLLNLKLLHFFHFLFFNNI